MNMTFILMWWVGGYFNSSCRDGCWMGKTDFLHILRLVFLCIALYCAEPVN